LGETTLEKTIKITIPEQLHRTLKAEAALKAMTMNNYIVNLLTGKMQRSQQNKINEQ
jgi:predicted HicB family RNase H-like nuclease